MEKKKMTLNLQQHAKLRIMSQIRQMTLSAYVDFLINKDHKKRK